MADLKEAHLFSSIEDQQNHWYYKFKVAVIRQELIQAIRPCARSKPLLCLDIGAGNGVISKGIGSSLLGIPLKWDLVDSEYHFPKLDSFDGNFRRYREVPSSKTYDIIIAIDVIEHVRNDREFSDLLENSLTEGGSLIICAPAFQFLWGPHDVFLDHQRRYTLLSLVALLAKTTVTKKRYLYQPIFPLALFVRIFARLRNGSHQASDLKIYPWAVDRVLFLVAMASEQLARRWALFGQIPGLSCFVVAKAPFR